MHVSQAVVLVLKPSQTAHQQQDSSTPDIEAAAQLLITAVRLQLARMQASK